MELQAEGWMAAMGECHDLAVLAARRDVERLLAVEFDDQGMVAPRLDRLAQAGEQAGAVMQDARGAAMHRGAGMDHAAAEGFADALVAEADAKDRQLAGQAPHQVER